VFIREFRPMTARFLTAALVAVALISGRADAQPPIADKAVAARLLAPFRPVVAKTSISTIRVRCDDKDVSLGTVVGADGLILTKASELRGQVSVRLQDGSNYDADIVGVHKGTDLALIKIETRGLVPVTFSDSTAAAVGNWLAAPGPTTDPISVGIVSVKTRKLTGLDATFVTNNNKGFLGVYLEDAPDKGGAKITEIAKGGAAEKAGLKKNDVIVYAEGSEITTRESLQQLLENYRPGDAVTVRVMRDEVTIEKKITLGKQDRTGDRSLFQNSMGGELSGRRTGFPAVLQTDMVVEPKNCGGPVVDLSGKVLGINIARAGRVETWVLPSEQIKLVLGDLKAGKLAPMPSKTSTGSK
jgi:serine protease Do